MEIGTATSECGVLCGVLWGVLAATGSYIQSWDGHGGDRGTCGVYSFAVDSRFTPAGLALLVCPVRASWAVVQGFTQKCVGSLRCPLQCVLPVHSPASRL